MSSDTATDPASGGASADVAAPPRVIPAAAPAAAEKEPAKKKPKKPKQAAAAAAGTAAPAPGADEGEYEIQLASNMVTRVPHKRPRLKNPALKALLVCEACSGALDFPYYHAGCQMVVCATCALGNRASPLCKACKNVRTNTSATYLTALTTEPHSERMANVVAAIAGRDWVNWVRDDLNNTNRQAYLEATVPRTRFVSTSDPEYRAIVGKPGEDSARRKGRRRRDDDDDDDSADDRRRAKGGGGCCNCLIGLAGNCLCCCGLVKCAGSLAYTWRRPLKKFLIFVIILAAVSWIATWINWYFTGKEDMSNLIYGSAGAPPLFDQPLAATRGRHKENL